MEILIVIMVIVNLVALHFASKIRLYNKKNKVILLDHEVKIVDLYEDILDSYNGQKYFFIYNNKEILIVNKIQDYDRWYININIKLYNEIEGGELKSYFVEKKIKYNSNLLNNEIDLLLSNKNKDNNINLIIAILFNIFKYDIYTITTIN